MHRGRVSGAISVVVAAARTMGTNMDNHLLERINAMSMNGESMRIKTRQISMSTWYWR